MRNSSKNTEADYKVKSEWLEHISHKDTPISHKMFTSQSYYDAFWERCEHGVLLLDEECRVVDANPFILDLLGTNLVEIKSKCLQDIISERTIRADYTNIVSIIKANQYSYETKTDVNHKFKGVKMIPVKLIAMRVPSSLNYPFKHVIVNIYDIKDAVVYNEYDYISNKSWSDLLKLYFAKGWVTKWLLLLITVIILFLGFSGKLMELMNLIFGTFGNSGTA